MDYVAFDDWSTRGVWGNPATFTPGRTARVVHHSVTDPVGIFAIEQARIVEEVIWARRIESRFAMVAYSWLIARDGTIFEGRGWTWSNGANTPINSTSISICFIGNFEENQAVPTLDPTGAQIRAAAEIIVDGIRIGALALESVTLPHNAVSATECPGDRLETRLDDIDDLVAELLGGTPMADTDLPAKAKAEFDRAVKLGISTGEDPNGFAERDEATVMAVRGMDRAIAAAEEIIAERLTTVGDDLAAMADAHQSQAAVIAAQRELIDALNETLTAVIGRVDELAADIAAGASSTPTGPLPVRIVAVGAEQ